MKKTHESYNRQDWNNENHADRVGWRPAPYDCREILDWLAMNPDKDNPLIRWFISTQNGTGAKRDGPQNTPF